MKRSIFITIALFSVLSYIVAYFGMQTAAASSNQQNVVKVKQTIDQSRSEAAKNAPKRVSEIIRVNYKTPTRIITTTTSLNDQQKAELEAKYDISFSKKDKSRKNRYVVTPRSEAKMTELLQDPLIMGVANNDVYKASAQTIDWGTSKINAPAAWSYAASSTGTSVVVAVIDTGIQLDHPELAPAIEAGGYDFVNDDADPTDDYGHGTQMAGIIAAANNTEGTVGVAYGAKLLPFKACDQTGSCSSLAIADAIDAAIDADVDIINMSFGGGANSLIQEAINRATSAGIIAVAAAGNEGAGGCLYPAAYENVVCVGSIDSNDAHPSFSNYGVGLDVVAPGVSIQSTAMGSTYATSSGTSASTAFYSGAAALLMTSVKGFCASYPAEAICSDKRSFVQATLNDTMPRDIGIPGTDTYFGKGAIDVSMFYSDTVVVHTAPATVLQQGGTYTQQLTVTNSNPYTITLTSCAVMSNNTTRTQTVPAFTLTQLEQGETTYTEPTQNIRYTTFTFATPPTITSGATQNFSYQYSVSAESQSNDVIAYGLECVFDNVATGSVEQYSSKQSLHWARIDFPTALKNVYFKFGRLRYNSRIHPYWVRTRDTLYLRQFDPTKLRLTNFYLYDYARKVNHGYTKVRINATTYYVWTNYYLPRGRKYAYIGEFQDITSGLKVQLAYPFYTW